MSSKTNSAKPWIVTPTWVANSVHWWRLWSVGRCIFATMILVGALLVASGNELYGTWLLAVTCGLVVVSWTGSFQTGYQRSVAHALTPIARSHFHQIESALDLSAELRLMEGLIPPTELKDVHEGVVQAMQEMTDGRWRLVPRDFLHHVTSTNTRRERLYAWRDFREVDSSGDDRIQSYIAVVGKIIEEFESKQQIIWKRYSEERDLAIVRMREIVPPKSRESSHDAVIDALINMRALVKQQRTYVDTNDAAEMARIARGLIDNEAYMRLAIRKIRRWAWAR